LFRREKTKRIYIPHPFFFDPLGGVDEKGNVIQLADDRMENLRSWLHDCTRFHGIELETASEDASFRRYFRFRWEGKSYVVMDAPPDKEPCEPFVRIGDWMRKAGVRVPEIFEQKVEDGFLVLSDFGDLHYQEALEGTERDRLYDLAIDEILRFQNRLATASLELPVFDTAWQEKELEIFREWCLPDLTAEEYLSRTRELIHAVDQIPKTFMHRDFHCRNLLLTEEGTPGVIDFQGAMRGPITYDLVSLLRDCYLDNDPNWIDQKVSVYRTSLIRQGDLEEEVKESEFLRWFDLAGLQRHLKCIGIFHRLKLRDGKPAYLQDVPRIFAYVETVLNRNPELGELRTLMEEARILSPL